IHPSRQQPTPSRHIPIQNAAAVQAALLDLQRANQLGWGAYFSAALRNTVLDRWHRGGQADLLTLPVLFADLDGELSASLTTLQNAGIAGLPPPSAMVGSGRGLHLYWLITPTQDFDLANRILVGLAKRLSGDTVTAINAMRLPGTKNTKVGVNRACQLLWLAEHRRYNLADFSAWQDEPVPPPADVPVVQVRAPPTSSTYDPLNPLLVQKIVQTLTEAYCGFVQKNGWIGSLCPCGHARDAPGKHFGFLPTRGVARCFGRHGQLLLHDLCTHMEIDPADYGGLYQK
ncbi:MAG: hypothetical protein K8I82_00005, partial [Anaerolineae bacterium]|nr:hypothetical protein [Anaerolineae bacterium]